MEAGIHTHILLNDAHILLFQEIRFLILYCFGAIPAMERKVRLNWETEPKPLAYAISAIEISVSVSICRAFAIRLKLIYR